MNDLGLFYECFGRELLGCALRATTFLVSVNSRYLPERTVFGANDRDGCAPVYVVDL